MRNVTISIPTSTQDIKEMGAHTVAVGKRTIQQVKDSKEVRDIKCICSSFLNTARLRLANKLEVLSDKVAPTSQL